MSILYRNVRNARFVLQTKTFTRYIDFGTTHGFRNEFEKKKYQLLNTVLITVSNELTCTGRIFSGARQNLIDGWRQF